MQCYVPASNAGLDMDFGTDGASAASDELAPSIDPLSGLVGVSGLDLHSL